MNPHCAALLALVISQAMAKEIKRPLKPPIGNLTLMKDSRIVGGKEAKPNSYPSILAMTLDDAFHCGANILSKEWVVTAAHCYKPSIPAENYAFIAGAHSMEEFWGEEQFVNVVEVIPHEEYQKKRNDICLFKVDPPFEFNDKVKPARLPPKGYIPKEKMKAVGWGALRYQGSLASTLQEVQLPIVSNEDCASKYSSSSAILDTHICAGYEQGGKDACQGDSGGPLYEVGNSGRITLVGITSFGRECATANFPGVYTRVSEYLGWLNEKTGISNTRVEIENPSGGKFKFELRQALAASLCSQSDSFGKDKNLQSPTKWNPSRDKAPTCFQYKVQRCDNSTCNPFLPHPC